MKKSRGQKKKKRTGNTTVYKRERNRRKLNLDRLIVNVIVGKGNNVEPKEFNSLVPSNISFVSVRDKETGKTTVECIGLSRDQENRYKMMNKEERKQFRKFIYGFNKNKAKNSKPRYYSNSDKVIAMEKTRIKKTSKLPKKQRTKRNVGHCNFMANQSELENKRHYRYAEHEYYDKETGETRKINRDPQNVKKDGTSLYTTSSKKRVGYNKK